MTKGGPGDKSSGGNVNTDSWFVDPLQEHMMRMVVKEMSGD